MRGNQNNLEAPKRTVQVSERTRRVLAANVTLAVVDLVAALAWAALKTGLTFVEVRSLAATFLFVEAGALFLVGGFTAYGGSIFVNRVREMLFKSKEEWTPDKALSSERNASVFVLLAALLLVESLLLSIL